MPAGTRAAVEAEVAITEEVEALTVAAELPVVGVLVMSVVLVREQLKAEFNQVMEKPRSPYSK